MKLPLTIMVLALVSSALAQSAASAQKDKPKTQIEAFAAETGAVIIKGYSELGRVAGMGSVEVDCREFINANTGKKTFGLVIKVVESGRLERDDSSFVDYDEIASLITGIDYIGKIRQDVTKLKNFEATYTTRGDFSVTVFNDARGKLSIAVSSGRFGRASAYLTMEQLAQLRALIVTAKTKIEEIK